MLATASYKTNKNNQASIIMAGKKSKNKEGGGASDLHPNLVVSQSRAYDVLFTKLRGACRAGSGVLVL